MEKDKSPYELKVAENLETMWENFEKTGSVDAFLRYVEKAENREELVPADLPS